MYTHVQYVYVCIHIYIYIYICIYIYTHRCVYIYTHMYLITPPDGTIGCLLQPHAHGTSIPVSIDVIATTFDRLVTVAIMASVEA